MDALYCLLHRRSIRRFQEKQISDEELNTVLEAASYAPTARGIQPAIIVAVQNAEDIEVMRCLNLRFWDRSVDPFYSAPTVVVVFADPNAVNHVKDASLVLGNMMNAAFAAGLGSCWINRAKESYETEEGKALMAKWGVPETYVGVGNCILGYPEGEAPKPKKRRSDYIRIIR